LPSPVGIHDVELVRERHLVLTPRQLAVLVAIADEGDQPAIGRERGLAAPPCEPSQSRTVGADRMDGAGVFDEPMQVRSRVRAACERDRPAVRRPRSAQIETPVRRLEQAPLAAAVDVRQPQAERERANAWIFVPDEEERPPVRRGRDSQDIAGGRDPARGATVGVDDEDIRFVVREAIALSVAEDADEVDALRIGRPCRHVEPLDHAGRSSPEHAEIRAGVTQRDEGERRLRTPGSQSDREDTGRFLRRCGDSPPHVRRLAPLLAPIAADKEA
jgi:hypothetical protein